MPTSVATRRERDDVSSVHSYPSQPRHYTTVRRYKYAGTLPDEERENETMRIVLRDRDGRRDSEEEIDVKVTERERTDGRGRSETYREVRRRSASRSSRSSSSSSSEEEEETRTVRSVRSPYTLEKYSKSTEYFSQPAPQPIVIRERTVRPMIIERDAPRQIIVRQEAPRQQIARRERREPNYELVERQRDRDNRGSQYSEEDFYYYKGPVREEEEPGRRRRHRHRHRHEEEAAAAGAGALALAGANRHRRHRRSDRDAYSDDDVVVIRRERSLSSSPDPARHRRHIGEGVVAGLAAAAVTRNRRKSKGENAGGRIGTYLGYGALGGVGAEVLSQLNRNRSRSRSRSEEFIGRGRGRRRGSGSRSRSRSKSISTKEAVAGVIGLGALAAIAYTAGKRNNKNANETTVIEEAPVGRGRSRSRSLFRRRTSTVSDGALSDADVPADSALNPQHRNNTIAKAGLAGAVAAGAYEWNKRRNSRSRSKGRVKEGVPIVATGLASAALAGLYERNKAKKEARSLSRPGRSRSAPASRRALEDETLVSYGDDPIEPDDRYRKSSRSRGRHDRGSYSPSVSPNGRHHSRDRSRSRDVAGAAAVAAAAGVAAHEAGKRRERRRNQKQRRQEEEDAAANQYNEQYSPTGAPSSYYPSSNAFPPPPTGHQQPYSQEAYHQPEGTNPAYYNQPNQHEPNYGNQGGGGYNPAQYGVTRGPTLPREDGPADHYNGYNSQEHTGYRDSRHPDGGPENVSKSSRAVHGEYDRGGLNGVRSQSPPEDPILSRHSSASTAHPQPERATRGVHFDVNDGQVPRTRSSASEPHEKTRQHSADHSAAPAPETSNANREDTNRGDTRLNNPLNQERSRQAREDQQERRNRSEPRRRPISPAGSADSGETIEEPDLADRFDESGRERRPSRGNSMTDHLEDMFRSFRRGE